MAADTCKGIMYTALFAGTVFKGTGTHLARCRVVKIQYFAQSAGNFSSIAKGSSETTRADPLLTFNAQLGAAVDRSGYFSARIDGRLAFQLILPPEDPLLQELQRRLRAKTHSTVRGSLWRTVDNSVILAIVELVNGHLRVERRFRQFTAVCASLGVTPRRCPGWEDPALSVGTFSFAGWLGGFIDGDGSFGLNQGKCPYCEITVHSLEVQVLAKIKKRLGGSISRRTAASKQINAYR